MEKIGIDIDQTLYSFDSEIRNTFIDFAIETGDKKYMKGAYSTFVEWRNLTDIFDDTNIADKAIDRVHSKQMNYIPFLGSVSVVNELAKLYEIKYISSRDTKYHTNTRMWLSMCRFPEGELICSNHDKAKHLDDCLYLIDDRPKTLVQFVSRSLSHEAFGLWTWYNRNLTDIDNIYLAPTWKGIEYYLNKRRILIS